MLLLLVGIATGKVMLGVDGGFLLLVTGNVGVQAVRARRAARRREAPGETGEPEPPAELRAEEDAGGSAGRRRT